MTNPLAHLTGNTQRAIATRKLHAERNRLAKLALQAALERMKQMSKARVAVNEEGPGDDRESSQSHVRVQQY